MTGTVEKLVVVITNIDTNATVERWVFDIITDLPQAGYHTHISLALVVPLTAWRDAVK